MTTVYVVVEGMECEGYVVEGVFSTEDKAVKFAQFRANNKGYCFYMREGEERIWRPREGSPMYQHLLLFALDERQDEEKRILKERIEELQKKLDAL